MYLSGNSCHSRLTAFLEKPRISHVDVKKLHMHSDIKTNKTSRWITGGFVLCLFCPLIFNAEQFAPYNLQGGANWWVSLALIVLGIYFLHLNAKKRWLCLPPAKQLISFLALGTLLTCLTAPHVIIEPEMSFHCIIFFLVITSLLWFLLRRFTLFLLIPCLILGYIESGAYIRYKVLFNSMLLAETMECSKEELLTYATATNISLLLAGILFISLTAYFYIRLLGRMQKRAIGGTILTLSFSLYILYPFVPNACTSFSQLGLVGSYKRCNRTIKDLKRASNAITDTLDKLPSPAAKPSCLPVLKGDEGCVIIFHIGESVRADRCGFNGYSRNTTPHLSANPRLISWKRCVASTPITVTSLAVLLTNARRWKEYTTPGDEDMDATCGSVLDLFKANGFSMHAFMGSLSRQSLRADKVLRLLTSACEKRHYTNDDVMETIDKIGENLDKAGKRNMFYLINNEGSHSPFYMYDHKNPPFTPTLHVLSPNPRYSEAVRNAYDNCVHYTDLFVHRVLQKLEGRPYVYIYVSDHGEYIGDYNGTWGRARATAEKDFFQKSQGGAGVCAFAVTSPEYEALHPQFSRSIQQLKESQKHTIGHEHFFHTLLGIAGIKTEYYNEKLDLCQPTVTPYTGTEPEDWPEHLLNNK